MKFIINATNLSSGGALQVTRSLLNEWSKAYAGHEFHFFLSPYFSKSDSAELPHWIQVTILTEKPVYGTWSMRRFQKQMRQSERLLKADAVLTVFGPSLWRPDAPHLCGFANGVFLFREDKFVREYYRKGLIRGIGYLLRRHLLFKALRKNADYFWVETSEAAQQLAQAIQVTAEDICVVGNTYPSRLQYRKQETCHFPIRLLYLSAYYPHKNFEILPKLIAALVERNIQVRFLLTLPEDDFTELHEKTTDKHYLLNLGPVNAERLQWCYDQCDATFIPSLLETFSATFPEAMQTGKPILCSDRTFARSCCGSAALYFDPENAEDIAQQIETLIQSPVLWETLVQQGLQQLSHLETPEGRAERLLQQLKIISQQKEG